MLTLVLNDVIDEKINCLKHCFVSLDEYIVVNRSHNSRLGDTTGAEMWRIWFIKPYNSRGGKLV